MIAARWFILAFLCAPPLTARTAAELGVELHAAALDPDQCYRIRDLSFQKGDASLYLTDGLLIFGKPIGGRVVLAAFHASETLDDAEVLLRPPDRSERAALASYTGAPNLSEHFRNAVFLFTDGTAEALLRAVKESPIARPSPDMGTVVAQRLGGVARNLASSFQVRLVLDLLTGKPETGMFFAAFTGSKLGNFDMLYDPMTPEETVLGQVTSKGGSAAFDVWASFQTRARLQSGAAPPEDGRLSNYRIETIVQPSLDVEVITRVTWTPSRPIAGALGFEIAPQMDLTAAKIDGLAVEIYRGASMRAGLIRGRANEPFIIVLTEPMQPGRAYELEFHHRGRVISEAGNGVYFVGARTSWYPSRGLGHALFDLTFRVPRDLNVVATGALVEEREEGEQRIVHRKTSSPVRLAGFNLGKYEMVRVRRLDIEIELYANRTAETALTPRQPSTVIVPPPAWQSRGVPRRGAEIITLAPVPAPDPKARMTAMAEEVAGAMEWMSRTFGPPPLKSLTVSPIPGFFGQGFPGLLYLSTLSFLNEKDRPSIAHNVNLQLFYSEILYAHEAAHQWWGNLVAAATYRDDWIQEALANYSAFLILERRKGVRSLETVLDEARSNLLVETGGGKTVESAGPITWGLRLRGTTAPDPWRTITYDKGSWILHMLRRRMGDQAFLAFLGDLRKRYEYRTVTTEQFRALAAEHSPKGLPDAGLADFFDSWVYGTGIPTLQVTSAIKGKAPKRTLTVTVRQSGVGEDFSVDVPVEVRFAGVKEPTVKWVRTSGEPATFTVPLRGAVQKVELAPGFGVLAVRK